MNKDLERAQNLMDVGQYEASMAYSLLVIAKTLMPNTEEPKRFPPDFFHRDVCQELWHKMVPSTTFRAERVPAIFVMNYSQYGDSLCSGVF